MNRIIKKLLADRKLTRIDKDETLIAKEIEAAKSDLEDAQDSLQYKKFKWATIQGYYSMFHSARALLFSRGYREKSHHALLSALHELFSGHIEQSLIRNFEEGMYLRQEADYGLKFSEESAIEVVENAGEFLRKASSLLKYK